MNVEIVQTIPHVKTMIDRDANVACHICSHCPKFETVTAEEATEEAIAAFLAKHRNHPPPSARYIFDDKE